MYVIASVILFQYELLTFTMEVTIRRIEIANSVNEVALTNFDDVE